jgi:hypothetical protein
MGQSKFINLITHVYEETVEKQYLYLILNMKILNLKLMM